jgi:RimJ/RimL family protein N-acetyltransferase
MSETKLKSARLDLRQVKLSDMENIHQLHSFPETDRFNTLGIPENREQTSAVIADWIAIHEKSPQRNFVFVVQLKDQEEFIGLIAINSGKEKFRNAEVWYKIHPAYWNKGYATEALKAILNFGFHQLNLHRMEAGCAVDNIGSIRTLEKAGMTREGRKRQVLPLSSGWTDNFEYAILSSD